jgi:protein tyrosine/serine phosphatase
MRHILTSSRLCTIVLFAAGLPLAATASSSIPGVGNFEKVNDLVYRGAQPTEQGFQSLAKLGIHSVVDLQESGSSRAIDEEKAVKAAGMEYISVPMEGMQKPSNESVAKVLAVLESGTNGPVFVHCHRGADRTGGVIACYRIEHDHWTNQKALSEARSMGMSWYQLAIRHYVQNYAPNSSVSPTVASISAPVSSTAATIVP